MCRVVCVCVCVCVCLCVHARACVCVCACHTCALICSISTVCVMCIAPFETWHEAIPDAAIHCGCAQNSDTTVPDPKFPNCQTPWFSARGILSPKNPWPASTYAYVLFCCWLTHPTRARPAQPPTTQRPCIILVDGWAGRVARPAPQIQNNNNPRHLHHM